MRSQVKWGKKGQMAVGKTVKPPEENNCRSRIAKLPDFKGLGKEVGKKLTLMCFF